MLFDVYGTLLVRIGDVHPRPRARERAVETMLRRHTLPATARELPARLAASIDREHAALRARGNANPEVSIQRIWAGLFPGRPEKELLEMIVEYELATHPVWLMPGCRNLLRGFAREGIVLGIISNAQFYTPVFLRALLGAELEDMGFAASLCLYSCDFGIAKPDPGLFEIARQRLREKGLNEKEAVMVGNDGGNDIEPAARSGFMTVLANLDRRSSEPDHNGAGPVRPDAVIRSLRSLKALIAMTE